MASATAPQTQPPTTPSFLLSYPAPFVLLITINRPKAMNSLTYPASWEAEELFQWFDAEPNLRVAVITGSGKAFCAGQDLIEQRVINTLQQRAKAGEKVEVPFRGATIHPPSGFGGLSRRAGKKPVVAAVNGPALGGGFELCLGCDLLIASPKAAFALPEASRGIYAASGGLSRLVRLVGITIASEIALTGRSLSPQEALSYGIINRVSATPESVVEEAVKMAALVASFSPDSTIVTRAGLRLALEEASVERASQLTDMAYRQKVLDGENATIGMMAFAKKERPVWVPSKL